MRKNEKCKYCIRWFLIDGKRICSYMNKEMGEDDFCSKYTSSLPQCNICGGLTPTEYAVLDKMKDGTWRYICNNCAAQLGTCNTCKNNNYCAFEQDNSIPDPKQVQQTMRQGNIMFQTNVKNPVRIEKTCKVNCKCFDENNGCLRKNGGTCANYL